MTQPLTAEEKMTLKDAAYGAVLLVSEADPGLLAMFRESFAASRALAGSSAMVREVLTSGPIPDLPRSTNEEIEARVLPALGRAMAILEAKAPGEAEAYRSTVLAACDHAAAAAGGVKATESAEVAKVRMAMTPPRGR